MDGLGESFCEIQEGSAAKGTCSEFSWRESFGTGKVGDRGCDNCGTSSPNLVLGSAVPSSLVAATLSVSSSAECCRAHLYLLL